MRDRIIITLQTSFFPKKPVSRIQVWCRSAHESVQFYDRSRLWISLAPALSNRVRSTKCWLASSSLRRRLRAHLLAVSVGLKFRPREEADGDMLQTAGGESVTTITSLLKEIASTNRLAQTPVFLAAVCDAPESCFSRQVSTGRPPAAGDHGYAVPGIALEFWFPHHECLLSAGADVLRDDAILVCPA